VNWRGFFIALLVAFIIATVFDIVLNGILLSDAFEGTAQYWRPPGQLYLLIPLGWLSMFIMMGFYGLLYVRTGWQGIRRGVEFGLLLGIAALIGTLGMAMLVPWPMRLILSMGIQQFGNNLILGVILGWMYRPESMGFSSGGGESVAL